MTVAVILLSALLGVFAGVIAWLWRTEARPQRDPNPQPQPVIDPADTIRAAGEVFIQVLDQQRLIFQPDPEPEVDGDRYTLEQWAELQSHFPGGLAQMTAQLQAAQAADDSNPQSRPQGARPTWADPLTLDFEEDPDPIRLNQPLDDWDPAPLVNDVLRGSALDDEIPFS